MDRRSFARGCTPLGMSVLIGAMAGALALIASGRGLTPVGLAFLLGGYVAGAVIAYGLTTALARSVGEWWHE